MADDPRDLEYATTDDLIDELMTRHPEGIVISINDKHPTEEKTRGSVLWNVNAFTALGLARYADRLILRKTLPLEVSGEDDDPDDD